MTIGTRSQYNPAELLANSALTSPNNYYAAGNTTNSSSGTFAAKAVSMVGGGNVSVGFSNGSLVFSATSPAGSSLVHSNANNVTFGIVGSTLTASASYPAATSLSFSNANNVTFGIVGSTLTASIAGGGGGSGADISLAGNTTGTLGLISSGTVYFAGGNNITLSQNGQSVTISGGNGVTETAGIYAVGNTTNSSSGTFDIRSMSLYGAGVISVGQSAGSILISAPGTTSFPLLSVGMSALGNTLGNTGLASNQLVMAGGSNITLSGSTNGGSMTISVIGGAGGGGGSGADISLAGNTTGTLGLISSGTVFFAGGNNITLSQNGQSVTISGGNGVTETAGIYAVGNTTNSSSGTFDIRSMSLYGAGIISVGQSAGSILISAPGTTSFPLLSVGMSTLGNTLGNTGIASNQLVMAGGSNITLSGSTNGGSMTISIIGGAGGGGGSSVNFSAGTTSGNLNSVVFSNSNNVSFGLNGSTMTASVPGSSSLYGGANITISTAGSTISIIGAAGGGGGSGADISLAGNTTGTLGLISSGTVYFAGGNNITLSQNGQSITISGAAGGGGGSGADISLAGNTTGTLGLISSGTVFFAGGNNITLSQNGQSITISGGNGVTETAGIYAVGNTTNSSSGTFDIRSMSLYGAGIISVGQSGGSILISAPGTTSFAPLLVGMSALGNTLGNTGLASNQLVMAGGSNITLSGSTNGGSMTISVIGGAGGGGSGADISLAGNTSGTLGLISSGTVFFAGGNNITLSQNGQSVTISGANAGGAQTGISGFQVSNTTYSSGTISLVNANGISFGSSGANGISASFAQSNQTEGNYAVGNTTGQSSSSVFDARSQSINGMGAVSVGFSNSSMIISAPPISSLVGAGFISISTNGSTITISGSSPQLNFFQVLPSNNISSTQIGNGSVQVYPIFDPRAFTATRGDAMIYNSASSNAGSSYAGAISMYMGLYTLNGGSLSLASSGSQSYQWTDTGGASYASISGVRRLSVPMNVNYTGGDIWVGVMSKTSSTNNNWFTGYNQVIPWGNSNQLQGLIGQASNNSNQFVPGMGIFSATSAAMPVSMAFSNLTGLGGAVQQLQPVQFVNSTY